MRKLIVLSFVCAGLFIGFSADAQEQGDIRASVSLVGGTRAALDTDNGESQLGLGINVGAEYLIVDQLSIAPSYSFFFATEESGVEFNTSAINVDARYYFTTGEFQPYALVGFTSVTAETTIDVQGFSVSASESAGGLNIGAGANYMFSESLFANAQVKYSTVEIEDATGDAGGQIVFGVRVGFAL
jgi:hypothetical protein